MISFPDSSAMEVTDRELVQMSIEGDPRACDAVIDFCDHTGTEGSDWNRNTIGGKTATFRRFLHAEHIIYRTAEPDDPARLGVSLPEDDMSRPLEGSSGRASGIAALLLQFRPAASGAEIRAGHADAGHAGWNKQKAANVTADLLFGNHPSGIVQSRAPRSSIAASFILCRERRPSGGLTTFDGGSTE